MPNIKASSKTKLASTVKRESQKQPTLTQGNYVVRFPREVDVRRSLPYELDQEELTQTQEPLLTQRSESNTSSVSGSTIDVSGSLFDGNDEEITVVAVNDSPLKKIKLSDVAAQKKDVQLVLEEAETYVLGPRPIEVGKLDDYLPTSMWSCSLGRGQSYKGSIKMRGYVDYLKCPVYIQGSNEELADKIDNWRVMVIKTMADLKAEGKNDYPRVAYLPQYNWARNDVKDISEDVKNFKMFPIHTLNKETIIQLINSCDNDEKATFVKKMASCKVYEVVYSPFTEVKNFYLYTKFDNNPVKKYAFGKIDGIADFSHLKRAQRM